MAYAHRCDQPAQYFIAPPRATEGIVMSDMTPEEVSDIRLKVAELEFRAKSDEAFLKQLQAEPEKVLQDWGFETAAADDIAAELKGDRPRCDKCDPFTCIITGCCFFTTLPPTKLPKALA
jgi:hypothetical protein